MYVCMDTTSATIIAPSNSRVFHTVDGERSGNILHKKAGKQNRPALLLVVLLWSPDPTRT